MLIGKVMRQRVFAFPFLEHIHARGIVEVRAPIIMDAAVLRQCAVDERLSGFERFFPLVSRQIDLGGDDDFGHGSGFLCLKFYDHFPAAMGETPIAVNTRQAVGIKPADMAG